MSDNTREMLRQYGQTGLIILLILAVTTLLVRSTFFSGQINSRIVVRQNRKGGYEEAKRAETINKAIAWTIDSIIIATAALMIFDQLGVDTTAILASAGIVGIALGFGATALVKDYLNGILLIFEDQYRVGDFISCAGISGTVEELNLRHTAVRDVDGTLHFVPNGEIRVASNHTRDFGGVLLDLPVGYDADLGQVRPIIDRVGQEMASVLPWSEQIRIPPTFRRVSDFQESAMVVRIMGETEPQEQWAVMGELRRRLKEEFDSAGIAFPLPQRVVREIPVQDQGKE